MEQPYGHIKSGGRTDPEDQREREDGDAEYGGEDSSIHGWWSPELLEPALRGKKFRGTAIVIRKLMGRKPLGHQSRYAGGQEELTCCNTLHGIDGKADMANKWSSGVLPRRRTQNRGRVVGDDMHGWAR